MNKATEKYTIGNFYADLNLGKIAPLYLFFGEEEFLIGQMIDAVRKAALQPGDEDFNLNIYYGNETDGAAIVNAAMSFPLLAARRLVMVKDFHHLDDKSQSLLLKYAAKPSQTSCLCLTSCKFTAASGVIKKLAPHARAIEAKRLYDNQVPAWIKSHVRERGYTISEEAASLLQINVGNSLKRLSSEIDKIELLKKEKAAITVADIEAVVGATKEYNVFEFCDAVAGREVEKSLRILNRLLELGESPIGILVMLNRHFAIMTKTKELVLKGTAKAEMANSLKINRYFLDKYLLQAQKYRRDQLQQIFQLLLTADLHLKTSYQKPRLTLETLLYEIFSSI
ncbi:DNA polymerase III subunit delta [candidate division KSB1 bacterium]|nr:DNA polymerase III subunit delta [candidate division KSB1 bacterium]